MRHMTEKWQTKRCTEEYDCWCRLIVTDNDEEAVVIDAGQIDTELAEYLVKLHNQAHLNNIIQGILNEV